MAHSLTPTDTQGLLPTGMTRSFSPKPAMPTDLTSLLEALKPENFYSKNASLKQAIAHLDTTDRRRLLEEFFAQISLSIDVEDPLVACSRLTDLFSLDELEATLKQKCHTDKDALQIAKEMARHAKSYLEKIDPKTMPPTLWTCIKGILDKIIIALDTVLVAFGISDFFKPSGHDFESYHKIHKIMFLTTILTALSALLIPLLDLGISASLLMGAILLSLFVFNFIYQGLLKPAPSELPKADNWTKQIEEGSMELIEGCDKYVEEIAIQLQSGDKPKQHTLIIGPTGVGKTETIKAFAQAVALGKYPKLAGKTVFYFNTAAIVGEFGDDNQILETISEAMGRHRNDLILVFDEIHTGCQKSKDAQTVGDLLLTYMDEKANNFPHVIGITTEKQYKEHIFQDMEAMNRRFKTITIKNMDFHETRALLDRRAVQLAPKTLINPEDMNYLHQESINKFPDDVQPYNALLLLSKAIEKTRNLHPKTADAVRKKEAELKAHYSKGSIGYGEALLPSQHTDELVTITGLEQELADLERQLKEEKGKLVQLNHMREHFLRVKTQMYHTVLKMENLTHVDLLRPRMSQMAKEFTLQSAFLQTALSEAIKTAAQTLEVPVEINKKLIDLVIQEELAHRQSNAQPDKRRTLTQGTMTDEMQEQ
jgi:DNA replication protein DnaC